MREKRKIAFFGGSFDPFHIGHLEMAIAAADQLHLDKVYFVPARSNPLKREGPRATAEQRLEMLRLGIAGHDRFGIWEGELSREGPSYTLHSIQHIERVYPNSHLFWLIGSDQLEHLGQWREIDKLVQKIGFILVQRPNYDLIWPGIPGLNLYPVANPLHMISSTEIRSRVQKHKPLHGMLSGSVEAYIRLNRIYA